MSPDALDIYDPHPDPTDLQMRALGGIDLNSLQLPDISGPSAVKLFVFN